MEPGRNSGTISQKLEIWIPAKPLERASEEGWKGTNFSSIAPFSKEVWFQLCRTIQRGLGEEWNLVETVDYSLCIYIHIVHWLIWLLTGRGINAYLWFLHSGGFGKNVKGTSESLTTLGTLGTLHTHIDTCTYI